MVTWPARTTSVTEPASNCARPSLSSITKIFQMSDVNLSCSTLRCPLLYPLLIQKTDCFFPFGGHFWRSYPPVPSIITLPLLPLLNLFSQSCFQVSDTSHCSPLSCLQKVCIVLKMQYSKIKPDSSRSLANSEWSEKHVPMALSDYICRTRMLLFSYW